VLWRNSDEVRRIINYPRWLHPQVVTRTIESLIDFNKASDIEFLLSHDPPLDCFGRVEFTLIARRGIRRTVGNLIHLLIAHGILRGHYVDEAANVQVLRLLSQYISIHECTDLFETPLFIAVEAGQLEVVRALIELGASINGIHHSPLYEAVWSKRFEITQYLIANGALPTPDVIICALQNEHNALWLELILRPRAVDITRYNYRDTCASNCSTHCGDSPQVITEPLHVHLRSVTRYFSTIGTLNSESGRKIELLICNGADPDMYYRSN
jgi:hypothetical protein